MEPTTGIGRMEAATEAALAETARANLIETRITSEDVQALNDTAQLEIYGSGDRTFTHPATGAVIASPDAPHQGLIEDMRHNPRFGASEPDRNAAADRYASEIEHLVDEGFELCQARMIMDLRIGDVASASSLLADRIASGLDPDEAADQVEAIYARKDERRRELIVEGGAFTPEEYEAVRNGEDLYDEDHIRAREDARTGGGDDDVAIPPIPTEVIRTPELAAAEGDLVAARSYLAQVRAGREGRTVTRNEYTQADLDEAIRRYDAAQEAVGVAAAVTIAEAAARGLRIEAAEFAEMVTVAAVEEAHLVTNEQFDIEIANAADRRFRSIYNFFGRNSRHPLFSLRGIVERVKKTAALGAPTALVAGAVGFVAAPAIAATGGAAAAVGLGVALATRITRGIAGAEVNRRGDAVTVAEEKRRGRNEQIDRVGRLALSRGDALDGRLASAMYRRDTEEVVGQNRRRAVKAGVVAGVMGAAMAGFVSVGLHHGGGGGGNHSGGGGHHGGGNSDPTNPGGAHDQPPHVGPRGPQDDGIVVHTGPRMNHEQLENFRKMVNRGETIRANHPDWTTDQVNERLNQVMAHAVRLQELEDAA